VILELNGREAEADWGKMGRRRKERVVEGNRVNSDGDIVA
jgi:hypothetical protein